MPDIKAGWTVKVHQKIQEGGKSRIQVFEGLVIKRSHNKEAGATITVRKVSNGIGVERVFPIYSPLIDKIEVSKKAKVRRSKLYYLRDKSAKQTRRKIKNVEFSASEEPQPEEEVKVEENVTPEVEEKPEVVENKEEVVEEKEVETEAKVEEK